MFKILLDGKQCRPWSDAAFCGIWSGSTLFAKPYLYSMITQLKKRWDIHIILFLFLHENICCRYSLERLLMRSYNVWEIRKYQYILVGKRALPETVSLYQSSPYFSDFCKCFFTIYFTTLQWPSPYNTQFYAYSGTAVAERLHCIRWAVPCKNVPSEQRPCLYIYAVWSGPSQSAYSHWILRTYQCRLPDLRFYSPS